MYTVFSTIGVHVYILAVEKLTVDDKRACSTSSVFYFSVEFIAHGIVRALCLKADRIIYVYMCIYIYIYVYMYVYIYIYIYSHTSIHTCMHACIHTYIHTCVLTYIHTYIHTYNVHTYIHMYISSLAGGSQEAMPPAPGP